MSEPPAAKRHKKNEDDLICPINLSLPFDPVTAEDGRVYERSSIEEYFHGKQDGEILSPITKEKIGKKLLPAIQQKNHIETLIENGAITGDLAAEWKKRSKQKKDMEDLVKKAEQGHEASTLRLAHNYYSGRNGFTEDDKLAYKWYTKAHRAGSVEGTVYVGEMLVNGWGVAQDEKKGMMYLGMAEGRGSALAAFLMGLALADGDYGLALDRVEAHHLLEKSLSGTCAIKDMNDVAIKEAQEKLDEITTDLTTRRQQQSGTRPQAPIQFSDTD